MDDHMLQKAKAALAEKEMQDTMKRLKLAEHFAHLELVSILKLPYLIIKRESDRCIKAGEMPPNKFYPGNWQTVQQFSEWLPQAHPEIAALLEDRAWLDFVIDKSKTEQGEPIDIEKYLSAEYLALKRQHEKSQMSFDNCTVEGVARRKYYLAHFLQGYNLDEFSQFDFFGHTNATAQEVETFKSECKALQEDFEKNPESYFTDFVPFPKSKTFSLEGGIADDGHSGTIV